MTWDQLHPQGGTRLGSSRLILALCPILGTGLRQSHVAISWCLDVTLPPVLWWGREGLFGLSAVALTPFQLCRHCWLLWRWHQHPHQPSLSPGRLWLKGTAPWAILVTEPSER